MQHQRTLTRYRFQVAVMASSKHVGKVDAREKCEVDGGYEVLVISEDGGQEMMALIGN